MTIIFLSLDDDENLNVSLANNMFETMIILRKTRRTSKFYPPAKRSKYIAIPTQVLQAGNHFIHWFQQGKEVNVPPNIGFLHHYRATCVDDEPDHPNKCIKDPTQVDRTIHKHKQKLLDSMNKVFLALSQQCNLS